VQDACWNNLSTSLSPPLIPGALILLPKGTPCQAYSGYRPKPSFRISARPRNRPVYDAITILSAGSWGFHLLGRGSGVGSHGSGLRQHPRR
jgi:hypothetical protein